MKGTELDEVEGIAHGSLQREKNMKAVDEMREKMRGSGNSDTSIVSDDVSFEVKDVDFDYTPRTYGNTSAIETPILCDGLQEYPHFDKDLAVNIFEMIFDGIEISDLEKEKEEEYCNVFKKALDNKILPKEMDIMLLGKNNQLDSLTRNGISVIFKEYEVEVRSGNEVKSISHEDTEEILDLYTEKDPSGYGPGPGTGKAKIIGNSHFGKSSVTRNGR